MGDKTGIEWTDASWNPLLGCRRVSPGCVNCYAERQAIRMAGPGGRYEGIVRSTKGGPRWTGASRLVPEVLSQPLRWKRPRRIFVDSMADLFFEGHSNEDIAAVFGVMAAAHWHTFQCLTKRPGRVRVVLADPEFVHLVAKAMDAALVDLDHSPTERWKTAPGYDGYEASSHGRVRSSSGILATSINPKTGRETVSLWNGGDQTTISVHRLVLLSFAGFPEVSDDVAEVRHRNGNKLDNRLANLRWGTRSENQREKVRHGSRGGPQKLTPEQVQSIRNARAAGGATQQEIADRFGISRSLVSMIESGKVWAPPDLTWPLPNVWLGSSVEDQPAMLRVSDLLATPAAVHFISYEPAISALDLSWWLKPHSVEEYGDCATWCEACRRRRDIGAPTDARIDWVIGGSESGRNARPAELEWFRSVAAQCQAANVAFFAKQMVIDGRLRKELAEFPEDLRIREWPDAR